MKHTYTWLLLACVAGSTQAQRVSHQTVRTFAEPTQSKPRPADDGMAKAAGDIVFSDDFANGLAGNNQLSQPWTVEGPDGAIWKYDNNGPDGYYSSNTEEIASTTGNNGFMIYDADFSNSDTTTDPVGPLDPSEFLSRDGYLVSPLLDLSATPNVHLTFEQRLRFCCGGLSIHFVDVSTDGGNNWPTRIPAVRYYQLGNVDLGTYSMYINLHDAIQADPTNVKIRFAWEGSAAGGNGMSHYHWQVDDVAIMESQYNDLHMTSPAFNAYNALSDLTDNAEFDITPESQVHELTMGSPVANDGQYEAINVNLQMVVTKDGSEVFNQAATAATMPQNALDSNFYLGYTPSGIGQYSLDLTLTSDSVDNEPSGNTFSRDWEVSELVYAQDEGARDNAIRRLNPSDNTEVLEYLACNFFWIENPIDLYAIQVALANGGGNSQVGGELEGMVLQSVVGGGFEEVGTTPLWEIMATSQLTSNGQANFQTLMFDQPLALNGPQEYCACLHTYGIEGGSPRVVTAGSGTVLPGLSCFMELPDGTGFQNLTATPMVRMNFDPSVGIAEGDHHNGVGLGQNFPNPAHDVTFIPYELKEDATVTLDVHDLSGKLVATVREGHRAAGTYRLQFNTSGLRDGVYFYSLTANDTRMTKRMTVIR